MTASTDLDTAALASYLARELGVEVTDVEVLGGGLNVNAAVSTADEANAYVLRRPNDLRDESYIVDLATEYRVLELLRDTPVPAPEPVLRCEDESVVGDQFLVTTYLDGAAVPLGSALPERFRTPAARRRVAFDLVDALADVHSVDAERFEPVCDRLTALDQVERSVDQLEAVARATGREWPTLWSVADWLRENAPAETETTLVHGDFRPGNVLFAGTDQPEISGVLDWETAMLGDPLTELGYLLLRWRDDGDPTPDLAAIDATDAVLERLAERNERGLAPFTGNPGSPSRRDLVARYEDRTGRSFEHDRFYRAHAAFMLATVWADFHRLQVAAGTESNWPPHVEYVATLADSIARGDFEL